MHSAKSNKYTLTFGVMMATACTWTALASHAQGPKKAAAPNDQVAVRRAILDEIEAQTPAEAPGEAVVRLAPGANAQLLAQQYGVRVKRRLRFAPDTYVLEGIQGALDHAIAQLNATPGVLSAQTNKFGRWESLPLVRPNDPLLTQQWPLRVMNAEPLWSVTVGERFVTPDGEPRRQAVVGLIDAGCEISHPDLADNIHPNGFDFTLDQPYDDDDIPFDVTVSENHGTAMAGCIAPVNNNGTGISALGWEAVKILPCRITRILTSTNGLGFAIPDTASVIDAVYYCIQQDVDVISMSFSVFPDQLVQTALRDAYNKGIVLVAASGNGRFFGQTAGVSFPARMPEVLAVGGVGPAGDLSFFSDGGPELDVMAPAGNDSTFADPSRQVLSTASPSPFVAFPPAPDGYEYGQGTSQATAFTSGAVATLITQGAIDESLTPVEQVERVRQLLLTQTRSPFGGFSVDYGFGLINPDASLRQFTPHIDILAPTFNEATPSFSEPVLARLVRPVLSADPNRGPGTYRRTLATLTEDDFTVEQNFADVSAQVKILDDTSGLVEYEPPIERPYLIGPNDLDIVIRDASDPTVVRSLRGEAIDRIPNRAYRFRLIPRVEQPGLKLFSIPYELRTDNQANTPEFLFGGNPVKFARWVPERRDYAIYDPVGSPQDAEAKLDSRHAGVARPPIGMGFWARVQRPTQLQLFGKSERSSFYAIPLKPGFNMIGNPYPFRVPWNTVSVQSGQEIMSISEAAQRNLIRNTLFRYVDGRYTFTVLPAGELVDWEGHWVRAFAPITLLIPRVQSTIGNGVINGSAAPAAKPGNGWRTGIRAVAEGRTAAEVFVGAATGASDGFGPEDVENPPAAPGKVDVRISHGDWGRYSGRYAQDVRAQRSRLQSWTLEVETSEAGIPVKLTWDRLPAGVRGFFQVEGQRKPQAAAPGGSLQFTASRAGVHKVTFTTVPSGS